jgi:protein SCO1
MPTRLLLSLGVATAVALAAVLLTGAVGSGARATGWPTPQVRSMTHLSSLPGSPAPGLTLTDQRGQLVSLAALRGRVVIIEPMDPKCTNLCPLISQEFVSAAQVLGGSNSRVTFLGINVNQFHARIADVQAFSREHHLDRLPNWHFLTGTTAQLRQAWHEYAIAVQPNRTGDVIHSALMYFVDAQGRERWLAFPSANPGLIAQWGQAIADVAKRLLS